MYRLNLARRRLQLKKTSSRPYSTLQHSERSTTAHRRQLLFQSTPPRPRLAIYSRSAIPTIRINGITVVSDLSRSTLGNQDFRSQSLSYMVCIAHLVLFDYI